MKRNVLIVVLVIAGGFIVGASAWLYRTTTGPISPTATPTPVPTMTVKAYFMSSVLDPDITCEKVFPVTRTIDITPAVGAAALGELLKGPTDAEQYHGYTTAIPDDVHLKKLTIVGGVARADFDEALERGVGGSCRVGLIRRQITETLKQFSTVSSVIISIDGRTEDILQP